ncbi:MAG TPA: deoxyguanosinetriphosphate triphosphohydrolase, partial [Candidatus Binataceae bacterium]|nr:deoxyguanosinetriphosphate triphosphohydrolase [Candidatus Binataceae bacterium]
MLRNRENLEAIEESVLAPYGMRSRDSRGRRFPELPHLMRTAFQRDRDRIVHSSSFRRLEYKTQVFVNHEGDYYRTRLTHTIETAQITRTIAGALGLNPDLAEAVALGHDLGHTPFGHAGERVLNELMQPYGGYDHNAQSLRTVDWIERHYPNFRGLNLSFEVREGIIKHSHFHDRPAAREFDPSLYPCLEAQIVDLADEIAYLAHDADDGVKAQMLTVEELMESQLYRDAATAARARGCGSDSRLMRHQTKIRMIDTMVTDLEHSIERELETARIGSVGEVKRAGRALANFSLTMVGLVGELKTLMHARLYNHYRVSRMTQKAARVLARLFEAYLAEPRQMPPHVQARTESDGDSIAR